MISENWKAKVVSIFAFQFSFPMSTKMSNHKLTTKQYVVPFILVTSLFFLWGFARAILDVLNKHFQNELHITITQSSLIQVTTYLGYFLMAIPAGLFINRYGYRRGVVFGLLLFGMGALLFIPGTEAGTFYAFLGALFVIGCGLTFLETAANPYVTELGDKETSTSRLNFFPVIQWPWLSVCNICCWAVPFPRFYRQW